jgi:hypothetical protein
MLKTYRLNQRGNSIVGVTVAGALATVAVVSLIQLALNYSKNLSKERAAASSLNQKALILEYLRSKFVSREMSNGVDGVEWTIQNVSSKAEVSANNYCYEMNAGTCSPHPDSQKAPIQDPEGDYVRDGSRLASLQTATTVAADEKQKAYVIVTDLAKLSAAEMDQYKSGTIPLATLEKTYVPVRVSFDNYEAKTAPDLNIITVKFDDGELGQILVSDPPSPSPAPPSTPPPATTPTTVSCSNFTIKWSETVHGQCDYAVTGSGNTIVINDGQNTLEKNTFQGSIPCSPWEGNYGNLRYTATVYNSDRSSSADCSSRVLNCNMQMMQISNAFSSTVNINGDGSLTYGRTNYRHWLWVFEIASAWSGLRSATVGSLREDLTYAKVGQVSLTVGSSGNYAGGTYSKSLRITANELKQLTYTPKGRIPSPLSGTINLGWTGSGGCPTCGFYLGACSNRGFPAPPIRLIINQRSVFDYLKP